MAERVMYVVRSWPRLSQTFVVNEILALERRGVELTVFALARSGETLVQPQVAQVRADVVHLDGRGVGRVRALARDVATVSSRSPLGLARMAWLVLRHPDLAWGYGEATALECLGHAVAVAAATLRRRSAGERVTHLHAHFAHDPALVGLMAAELTGLPFTFTGHARDLLQIPASSLAARARAASAVVTCCEANADYIREAVPAEHLPPVLVVHHGVELSRFAPVPPRAEGFDGTPVITSVGRLVEKKGFEDLLRALALLRDRGVDFGFRLYGEGPLHDRLVALRDELGLRSRVELMGARDSDEVVAALASTDVFTLAPRVTDDGDRDGIPNVLVEAMACGLPVVTTAVGGIPELVHDQHNGLVVEPGNVAAVADSLHQVLKDPRLRQRLGTAARASVVAGYDVDDAARRLHALFTPGVEKVEVPA